jgi:tetratricopeptide (TPR) repeat protein
LNSLITLAVTGIVALLVEKKLHWLMIILPMRKDGIIPPSMLQAPQERTDSEGRGFSSIMKLLNVALTLALYGGVAFAGYRCYSIYTDQVDARLEVNAALESLPDAKDTAFVILEDYREKYPADREVLLSMSKAYLGVAEVDNALALADAFRDFKEPTVEDLNYIQTAEFYVRGALTTSKRRINKNEAHRSLVLDYRELYSDFLGKKEYLKIGEALLKANENSQEAYRAIALYHKSNKGFKECREWCTKGLEKDKGDVRLFCLVAESYYLEGDKMAALKALIEVDAITTDDEEAIKLRAMVLKL